jgi:hypothetical protein
VPPIVNRDFTRICQQHDDMCCARTDFVIAAGTPICLEGSSGGYRSDFVVVAVGAGFHPAVNRQRPRRLLPTRPSVAPRHDA